MTETIPGTKRWPHWSKVRPDAWPWPNFPPEEMACKGTGAVVVTVELMDKLEALRAKLGGRPLIVTSGHRSRAYNASPRVGGARNSGHIVGTAADVWVGNHDPARLIAAAMAVGFTGIQTHPDQGFIHLDTRMHMPPDRRQPWRAGKPFPPRDADAGRFAPEPAPRSVLATGTGRAASTGAAGVVAALAAAAPQLVEVAQHPLAQVVPYIGGALAVLALVALVLSILRKRRAESEAADA